MSRPLISVFLLLSSFVAHGAPAVQPVTPDVLPHRLLFALREGASVEDLDLPGDVKVQSSAERFPSAYGEPFGPPAPAIPAFFVADLPPEVDTETLRQRLASLPEIAYVEYDGIGSGGETTPNDPDFSSQWHLPIVGAPLAWDTTMGSREVTLAILDTGINSSLPDFSGRVERGYDFENNDGSPDDDHGHGSAVAAVAAGTGNNGVDSAGIDWRCRIMPVKVLGADNNGFYSVWAEGIRWATDRGADVINLSAGGNSSSFTLQSAIDYAIDRGVVFVTISHNDGEGSVRFPGRYARAITVGATQNNGVLSPFSNYGESIDLVAPGGIGPAGGSYATNITSTNWNGDRRWFWGTSFAAPQVAGAACLLLSQNPGLRHDSIEQILCAAADDGVGDARDVPGFDVYHGYGQLNMPAALTLLRTIPTISHDSASDPARVLLEWPVPNNAVSKRPLAVEVSANMKDWTPVPDAVLRYTRGGRALLTDDGSAFGAAIGPRRYYRWFIKR